MHEKDEALPGGEDKLPQKPKPLQEGVRRDGKSRVALPEETIDALRVEREQGATFESLADKFDLAINTIRKYCADIVTLPQKQLADKRIVAAAEKGVTGQHIQRVSAEAKRKNEETIMAGETMQKLFEKYVEEKLSGSGSGSTSFSELKEILMMKFMVKAMGGDDGQQAPSVVAEMRIENDRQRQFYEDKLKEQDAKLRELVFEKKIETLGEKQTETEKLLLNRLDDINAKVEEYMTIPPNASPEQKKDAITQLEDAGNQLERLKSTMSKFGIIQQAPTSASSEPEVYRNPDGSVNKVMYFADRIAGAVEKGLEAYQKKTPERGEFVETPAASRQEPRQEPKKEYVMQMDPQEYYELLLLKSDKNKNESAFIRQWEKMRPQAPPPERREAAAPAVQPAEQPAGCGLCGRPEIYQDNLCEQCWNDQNRVPEQPKKGIIDRLKEQEEEEIRRTQGLV